MQNEKEELDSVVDIYFSKMEVMAFFDKIQFLFDSVITKSVEGLEGKYADYDLLKVVAEHYSENVDKMIEYCKEFISLFDEDERIAVRRIINIFDTVQVDLVAMNEDDTEFPEIELVNPEMEPTIRTTVLEIALKLVDQDVNNLTMKANEKLQDVLIMEMERRKMKDEGVI